MFEWVTKEKFCCKKTTTATTTTTKQETNARRAFQTKNGWRTQDRGHETGNKKEDRREEGYTCKERK